MALNDIFRATASFTGSQGQTWQWVWHYQQITEFATNPTAMAQAVNTMLGTAWQNVETNIKTNVIGDTLQWAEYVAADDQFDTKRTLDISHLFGASNDGGFPANVAPYVTFPTNVGRSTGKKFLFGITEFAVENGQCVVTLLADLALYAAAFNNVLTAGNNMIAPGNFNQEQGLFRQWSETEVGVGLFTGSQYRRLPGRGI